MKPLFITLLLLGWNGRAAAQLNIGRAADDNRIAEYTVQNALPYDSLAHITRETMRALPGQTLFMHGASNDSRGYPSVFFTDDFRAGKAPVYKGEHLTPAEAVVGKYFDVVKVRTRPNSLSGSSMLLREQASGDLVWFDSDQWPRVMTCVGCYEKLKQLHVGGTFYGLGLNVRSATGGRLLAEKRSVWRCVDLEIEMHGDGTVLLLENEAGERVKAHPAADGTVYEFVSDRTLQEAVARFGAEFGERIALREAAVGMTAEMVRAAWGRPFRTSDREIEGRTIAHWYFDGGRSVTIADGKVVEVYISAW